MTKETLQEILHILELDYEAEPTLAYVFYRTPDGQVNNFSISIRHGGGKLSDEQLQELMHREYPSSRGCATIAVERPHVRKPLSEWLDVNEVCQMLHISDRTLRSWTHRGLFHPSIPEGGRKKYYRRSEIDHVLEANAIQENGRLDQTALVETNGTNRK